MKLVIDIPDKKYKWIKENTLCYTDEISEAIRNGTPLPKGHGRLIDGDALRKGILSWGMNDYEPSDFIDEIDMADVIIEAESEELKGE